MGHTYGTMWTDELISAEILRCKEGLCLNRMPSRNEMRSFFGDDRLTNRVSKTYGYYGWADRLGLPMKQSDTETGKAGERFARQWLEGQGFYVEALPQNYPYDLFVNKAVKVDVKYSNLYVGPTGSFYTFKLGKEIPTCDVYILVTHLAGGKKEFYVIPSREVMQKQISIGEHSTIYHKYKGRSDIIVAYETVFRTAI